MKKVVELVMAMFGYSADKGLIICAFQRAAALDAAVEESLAKLPVEQRQAVERLMKETLQSPFALPKSSSEPSALLPTENTASMIPPPASDKPASEESPTKRGRGRPRKPKFPPDPSAN